jgi:hypothetical protein
MTRLASSLSLASLSVVVAFSMGCPNNTGEADTGIGGMDARVPPGVDAPAPGVDVYVPPGADVGRLPDVRGACIPTIEICGDRMDQNCDGRDMSCGDTDRDGIEACRAGQAPPACDCDDANNQVYPPFMGINGGAEQCDGLDNNCNGRVDEAAACCEGCASLGADRGRADVCDETGACDCSTEPGTGPCAAGQTCCTDGCTDTTTDINNCGLCGSACGVESDRCAPGGDGRGTCRCGTASPCADARMCRSGACG